MTDPAPLMILPKLGLSPRLKATAVLSRILPPTLPDAPPLPNCKVPPLTVVVPVTGLLAVSVSEPGPCWFTAPVPLIEPA